MISDMNNYLSSVIPNVPFSYPQSIKAGSDDISTSMVPQLRNIFIYNPSYSISGDEDTDELAKQILCFIDSKTVNLSEETDSFKKVNLDEVKLLGLVRGVIEFGLGISNSNEGDSFNIKARDSTIYVLRVESKFYICLTLTNITENRYDDHNNKLLESLQRFGYHSFVFINGLFEDNIKKKGDLEFMIILQKFWHLFYVECNKNFYFSQNVLGNYLSYRGFFEASLNASNPHSFIRSSCLRSDKLDYEINRILEDSYIRPNIFLVSYLSEESYKRNGIIYSSLQKNEQKSTMCHSINTIYDYIESCFFKGQLSREILSNGNSSSLFSTNFEQNREDAYEPNNSESGLYPELASIGNSILSPLRYTSDLFISPVSNGFSQLVNLGNYRTQESYDMNTRGANEIGSSSLVGSNSDEGSFDDSNGVSNIHRRSAKEEQGFIIGSCSKRKEITKKNVYLCTNDGQNRISKEYNIIIYQKGNIYFSLLYPSSDHRVDDHHFYDQILEHIVEPICYEISTVNMSNSISSTLSASNLLEQISAGHSNEQELDKLQQNEIDENFFFITYDSKNSRMNASLPYILSRGSRYKNDDIEDEEIPEKIKKKKNYQHLIFNLHRKLSEILSSNFDPEVFKDATLNEFFHKFSGSRSTDWVIYSFRYKDQTVIIIKANHNNRGDKPEIAVPEDLKLSFLRQITDYAHLEFVENLGDDVKVWLELFNRNTS